ncbi:aminotransferase class I/II-fold pyridoxal phosphate-dependent enzyme [Micromonospora sp. NPDC051543]|uniref:aminotransferase class I/II-fold pyridoxal phosphate-dependent enzyme n=1 Tax=Micromonospora sp. NPDC051543 TaxID=3364287 RepID=UPI0037B3EB2E
MTATIDLTGRQPGWPAHATQLWSECVAEAIRDDRHSRTPPRAGLAELRAELGQRWGMDPERMVVTTGVCAAAALLTRPGDVALVESPGFSGLPATLRAMGADVTLTSWERMPADAAAAGEARCWVTSPGRNPDGATLPAAIAERIGPHRLVVNEIYRPYDPDAAVVDADIRLASLSKVAGGGSRLGWLTVPPDQLDSLLGRHLAWPATLSQLAWTLFLRRGGLDEVREVYVMRCHEARTAFVTVADGVLDDRARAAGGSSLLLSTAQPDAVAVLRDHGVLVGPGPDFLAGPEQVRLCFSDVTPEEATDAGHRIVSLVNAGRLTIPQLLQPAVTNV